GQGLHQLLADRGFTIKPGQLEIFPNPKTYQAEKPTLFNAHRLPLQSGSYLLDSVNLQPIWSSPTAFVRQWQRCRDRNQLDTAMLSRLLKRRLQRHYLSIKADKFLNDLNIEIESGWTGPGQTNRLLGRIAMRTYIFHQVITGEAPLAGTALAQKIVDIAIALPGYRDWCRHQHEIEVRAADWARCVENSHYFPYGQKASSSQAKLAVTESWNQQQARATQEKISQAVADLISKENLPLKATARFKALLDYGIGGASLYRYRTLWHPESVADMEEAEVSENSEIISERACAVGAARSASVTSLLPTVGSNVLSVQLSSDLESLSLQGKGSNSAEIRDRIRADLAKVRSQRPQPQPSYQPEIYLRMRDFISSADPILMAEAGRWLEAQPQRYAQLLAIPSDEPEQTELGAAIARQLARLGWSAWQVREALQQQFQTDDLGQLGSVERQQWLADLQEKAAGSR
ncbi:MAG: hypothetical protein F6J97_14865, partial [Leptolyngbya sp. SIO4C1]|nr:hypothetical protein [Leptolyngbya sp. SIO4C1]